MDAYTSFAQVYDELMDNIPYDEWISYITSLLHEYNITEGLVAELGCGTGTITEGLAAAGYDMIGIDVSSDMLEIANEKKIANGFSSIMYLQQDMSLYASVTASTICQIQIRSLPFFLLQIIIWKQGVSLSVILRPNTISGMSLQIQ